MRGDSVRDLYAKGLALVGLSLLAATGALVDYWPTGIVVPAVGEAIAPPGAAQPVAALPDAVVAPAVVVVAAVRPARPSRDPGPMAPLLRDRPPELATVPADSLAFAVERVALAAPPRRTMPAVTLTDQAGAAIALSDPALFAAGARSARASLDFQGNQDDDGVIAGAFKKTGISIVRTGRKTGSSIVGAVKSFGAAMRRVLPAL